MLQKVIGDVKEKKKKCLFCNLFQIQKQGIASQCFFPSLRIHSSWKKSLLGALSGISHQDALLLRVVQTHNHLLTVAKGQPRKWEWIWLLRPSERARGQIRMRTELDIWDIRPVFYLLIAVLESQGVPDQWHLPVYGRKIKKREMPWQKSVFASNQKATEE